MKLKDFLTSVMSERDDRDNRDGRYDDDYEEGVDEEDDEEEGHLEPVHSVAAPRTTARPSMPLKRASNPQATMSIEVVEPMSFEEGKKIMDVVLNKGPIVVNFGSTDQVVMTRLTDFFSGATYSVGGNITRVSPTIFIVSPAHVAVNMSEEEVRASASQSFSAPAAPTSWADMRDN